MFRGFLPHFIQIHTNNILFLSILQDVLKNFFKKFYIFAKNHIFSGFWALFCNILHPPKSTSLGGCIVQKHI